MPMSLASSDSARQGHQPSETHHSQSVGRALGGLPYDQMPDEPRKVPLGLACPRCGSSTTGVEYCGVCGLHLTEQDELPTRERWERLQAEDAAGSRQQRKSASGSSWGERWSSLSRASRTGLLGGVGALVAALVLVAAMSGDSRDSVGDAGSPTDSRPSAVEPAPEERCVDRWNAADFPSKIFATNLAQQGEVVATVGFSNDFPDRCQIVIAAPDLGGGIFQVFRESSDETQGPFQAISSGSPGELPESAKQWNARISSDGAITFGYP